MSSDVLSVRFENDSFVPISHISQTAKNVNTQNISDDDVFQIWEKVSTFISRTLLNQKGVHIPNFGTFSFIQKKLDVGNSKFLLIQRPVFQLSEKICQTHGLSQTKQTINGSIPVVQLNYAALAVESHCERDKIETCVRETLGALNRSVATQSSVELVFSGIGRLQFRLGKVKFKFFKEFVNTLDSSGTVVRALQKRPNTADSVMTDRPPSRAFSVALPRLNSSGSQVNGMPTITEHEVYDGDITDLELQDLANKENDGKLDKKDTVRSSSRQSAPMAMATDYNFVDLVTQRSEKSQFLATNRSENQQTTEHNLHQSNKENADGADFSTCELPQAPAPILSASLPIPRPPPSVRSDNGSSTRCQNLPVPRPPSTASSCGHPSTGQELCYFCMQRRRRNVPVSFTEEMKRREQEEDNLLKAYNELKDKEQTMKDQEVMLAKRHDAQKIAAFNLGVCEAQKDSTVQKDPTFKPSYIFQKRPLTPPRQLKMNALSDALNRQVELREETKNRVRSDEAFLERLEQVQLAEDLAAQREKFAREKQEQKEMYKRALSAQLRYKPVLLPEKESDSKEPVFGKNDITEQKLLEKRRRAEQIAQSQIDDVSNKRREQLLRRLQEQKYEEEVHKRTKEDMRADRAWRFQRKMANRQYLEDDWASAAEAKRQRDAQEALRYSTPAGLLHEQCDRYHRCGQCKRKLVNGGESNLWCETYYIPGTRYIT